MPALSDSAPTTGPSLVFEEQVRRADALNTHSIAEDLLGLATGTFLTSLGLHLLHAAHAVTGGTAGLSLLLGYVSSWPFWVLFALINVPFAFLAVWRRGWNFTLRTVIAISAVSVWALVHEALFPIAQINPWYAVLAGNLISGVGVLILFRHRASVGGVNIVGLEVQDRTGFRAGWTMMIFDLVIILSALWVMPWPNVAMSAAGAVVLNLVLALNHRPGRYLGH